ncbi:DNA-processing protein DprA [Alkaliphilus peptidifermentans]|uniref:DNA processing protein n=1 Tax=Alkaliphilus peptidifermentans DSM 18978 TaxID=1120976 RepID=A0A1G5DIR5_9FIRM|nr:DNA-processing protein DprA [Alkaliphilus peptidifermentans]SCY14759.1 DNA processing protein [Alkaliphilus peptidifermentans DSM 18978]
MVLKDRDLLIWLNHVGGISSKRLNNLTEYFGSLQELWKADELHIKKALNNNRIIAESLIKNRNKNYLNELIHKITEKDIRAVTIYDHEYPDKLKCIYDPPYVIYIKGRLILDNPKIAIVGARKASTYGRWAAFHFARELALWGVGTVSGMALGVDTEAHKGSLAEKMNTIAVLGCGVDLCYPASNSQLMLEILNNNGCILSEYPPGTPPMKHHFPARNRIISGLSDGVFIVEAAEKSGAIITVDFALEQGKEVFALPGNINNSQSKGTNSLIKDGAKIVLEVDDLLDELKKDYSLLNRKENIRVNVSLSDKEAKIYNIIKKEPIHIDLIVHSSGMKISELNPILTVLELKGFICQLRGKTFTVI